MIHFFKKKTKDEIILIGLLFFLRFYLFTDGERESTQAGRAAEGEADSPLSREPDTGLNPRTLGS